ncbi:hypothetical protein CH294_05910 [Rhodococcus sp. 14-2483-1-1]|uniref:hypothetical protein n=1 Tax=Rhodococcus sp. 14-2483-1-1 TaxID=2023148 RepID=UPI000B9BF3A9|nr:hypothetical protein [Rhodococcus sp. 14-2483-1-1]OZF39760.1 hypothetical protein CH294_05910 [Rhodococcus sp. 14-2483-1-1]
MNTALALGLIVGVVAFSYASSVGLRGKALHPDFYGRDAPDRVKTSPHLRAAANRLFAICGIVAAILLLAPLVWLFSDLHHHRTAWELAGLAAYVFVVVVIGGYPFEKIKTL